MTEINAADDCPDIGQATIYSARMLHQHVFATLAITVPAFAVGGAVSRYSLRTTETRWQIAAFVALAASVEIVARMTGPNRASVLRGILNAAVATVVIVSVKLHLEPDTRRHDRAIVRHAVGTAVKEAVDVR